MRFHSLILFAIFAALQNLNSCSDEKSEQTLQSPMALTGCTPLDLSPMQLDTPIALREIQSFQTQFHRYGGSSFNDAELRLDVPADSILAFENIVQLPGIGTHCLGVRLVYGLDTGTSRPITLFSPVFMEELASRPHPDSVSFNLHSTDAFYRYNGRWEKVSRAYKATVVTRYAQLMQRGSGNDPLDIDPALEAESDAHSAFFPYYEFKAIIEHNTPNSPFIPLGMDKDFRDQKIEALQIVWAAKQTAANLPQRHCIVLYPRWVSSDDSPAPNTLRYCAANLTSLCPPECNRKTYKIYTKNKNLNKLQK